ncbi:MAG: SDR family oxidoreductase [Gammaproteobacteria bacterium]
MIKFITRLLLVLIVLLAGAIYSMKANISDDRLDVDMDISQPMATDGSSYLIFGGTRNSGLEVAKLLTARGDKVTAFVRPSSDRSQLEALDAAFVVGDATDAETVVAALNGGPYKAVISTLGCFRCDPPPDFIGNRNIVDAAAQAGVRRMVLITSIGAGNSYDAAPVISRFALKKILPLKEQAEEHIMASGLDYTIIRPGGMRSGGPTGGGYLSEDPQAFGFIYRSDLAQLVVAAVDDDRTIGKTLAAADANKLFIFQ